MQSKSFKHNSTMFFVLIGTLIIGSILFVELLNGRFWLNDFKVMYSAATAFLSNEQVYGVSFGLSTGFYKYSPFTMLCFIPYTLFPFKTAAVIHFLFIGLSSITVVIFLEKIIRAHFALTGKKHYLTLLAVLLCTISHLFRDLHLGNVNTILVLLLTLSLYFNLNKKPILAGLLLAFTVLAKPYFLICILPLLVYKRFKTVSSTIMWIIVFVIVSALIIEPWTSSTILYQDWFFAMMEHNNYLNSNHTIFSLVDTYFGVLIPNEYALYLLGAVGLLSSLFFYMNQQIEQKQDPSPKNENSGFIIHFYLLIAIIPNVLITDTEHFIFSMPLIAILLFHIKKRSIWHITLFIALIFMYAGNTPDLLGKNLSGEFSAWGILGISNLIIIGTIIYWFRKKYAVKSNRSTPPNKIKKSTLKESF